jgi:hypothetical protein
MHESNQAKIQQITHIHQSKQTLFEKAISDLNQKEESTVTELEDTKQLTLLLGMRLKEDMAKVKKAWQ